MNACEIWKCHKLSGNLYSMFWLVGTSPLHGLPLTSNISSYWKPTLFTSNDMRIAQRRAATYCSYFFNNIHMSKYIFINIWIHQFNRLYDTDVYIIFDDSGDFFLSSGKSLLRLKNVVFSWNWCRQKLSVSENYTPVEKTTTQESDIVRVSAKGHNHINVIIISTTKLLTLFPTTDLTVAKIIILKNMG